MAPDVFNAKGNHIRFTSVFLMNIHPTVYVVSFYPIYVHYLAFFFKSLIKRFKVVLKTYKKGVGKFIVMLSQLLV